MSRAICAAEAGRLAGIPDPGKVKAEAADPQGPGTTTPAEPRCMDPSKTYDDLGDPMGQGGDPRMPDTGVDVGSFMNGGPPRPGWHFTAQRNQLLEGRAKP